MKPNDQILGVRLDGLQRKDIERWIEDALENPPKQKFVVTLNPEIILKGYRNKEYANILNSADLKICDGFGLKFVSWIKRKKVGARLAGVEFVDHLLKEAKEKKIKVLVVVSGNSLSGPDEIRQAIAKKYGFDPEAEYAGSLVGGDAMKRAEIVLVNFGAPHQEKFIFENRNKFSEAKILAGVGGTFDFLTGKIRRAPRWMRKTGIEWLWRLWREPKRISRIWNAVVIFPVISIIDSKKCLK